MTPRDLVPAFEVLYASATDSFRTVQIHTPVHREYFKVLESQPIMLRGVDGWRIVGIHVPMARRGKSEVPLNQAIREGKVEIADAFRKSSAA